MPEHVPVLPLMTSLSGNATWYCNADPRRAVLSPCMAVHPDGPGLDLYAAAGPGLRAWLGPNWRGMIVETCAANRPTQCVLVKLSDWCLCTGGPDRLIDLYYDAFAIVGGKVTIRR